MRGSCSSPDKGLAKLRWRRRVVFVEFAGLIDHVSETGPRQLINAAASLFSISPIATQNKTSNR